MNKDNFLTNIRQMSNDELLNLRQDYLNTLADIPSGKIYDRCRAYWGTGLRLIEFELNKRKVEYDDH